MATLVEARGKAAAVAEARENALQGRFPTGFGCEGCGDLYHCRAVEGNCRDGEKQIINKDTTHPDGGTYQSKFPDIEIVEQEHSLCGKCDCARVWCPSKN